MRTWIKACAAESNGYWHPAFRAGCETFYWPNITQPTPEKAIAWAQASLDNSANVQSWNVWPWDE